MIKANPKLTRGFTLLEVVVALAMLALIAVPAVGLATMAVGSSKEQMVVGVASDLKSRVDIALRALSDAGSLEEGLALVATLDLNSIALESSGSIAESEQHFRVVVGEPTGYDYDDENDSYRILVYEVVWPYKTSKRGERNQLFFTSVLR